MRDNHSKLSIKSKKKKNIKMKETLSKIKPGKVEQEHFNKTNQQFLKKINSELKEAKAVLGGSGAKDTWLAGNHDIDIFVQYPYQKFKTKSAELSNLLEKVLNKAFPKHKLIRLHGSRDYFQLSFEKINFEVVPILKISQAEKAVNITDVSPLHALWVNKNLKGKKDEVRLAKQFFRANKLYGAESHINGFSGYVLEILTAKYGSFEKLLKATLSWKIKEVIDVEKHYPKGDASFHLNKSKQVSPLIIIDPVDKNRNAAAALDEEKFMLLKKIAQQYLKKPSDNFFEQKIINLEKLKKEAEKKKLNLLWIEVVPFNGKVDVIGVKLMKAYQFLEKELTKFVIKNSNWDWNKFYFFLQKKELEKFEIKSGPPLKLKPYVDDFKKKNKTTFIKNNKIMAKVAVKNPKLKNFVENLVKDKYFSEKVKAVKEIKVF